MRRGAKKPFYLVNGKEPAQERRTQILREMQLQEPEPPNPALSLEDLSESFLQYAHDNKAPSTYEFYRHLLSAFVRAHRGWAVADVTPIELEAFKRKLVAEQLSPTTVNHHLNVVQIMFNWAVKFGYLKAHDLSKVEKLKKPKGRIRFLSEDDEVRLLEASGPLLRDILVLLLNTGLRTSELAELMWDDVDLDHCVLTVRRSKAERTARNYRPRRIPLTGEALAILERQPRRAGHVFLNDDGKPFNRGTLRLRFNRARKKAGLDDVTLHTLRHTFASRLSMNGENLQTVAALLGHTNTRTTEIYSHLADEHLKRAVERLERSYGGEKGHQAKAQPRPTPRGRSQRRSGARTKALPARPNVPPSRVVATRAV